MPTEQSPAASALSSIRPLLRVSRPMTTEWPGPPRTRPAARPSRSASSGVRSRFATPRMPSVPNSLVNGSWLPRSYGERHPGRLHALGRGPGGRSNDHVDRVGARSPARRVDRRDDLTRRDPRECRYRTRNDDADAPRIELRRETATHTRGLHRDARERTASGERQDGDRYGRLSRFDERGALPREQERDLEGLVRAKSAHVDRRGGD